MDAGQAWQPGSPPGAVSGRGTVLIVEDSPESAALVSAVLEEEGFTPVVRSDGHGGLQAFESERPVAVLLDWVLPNGPGVDVCRRIREQNPVVPIFFVSGREDEASVSRALDAGADDFLVKPFRPRELVARLEASLRKVAAMQSRGDDAGGRATPAEDVRTIGEAEIDLGARQVQLRGQSVPLGPLEFRLLEYFVRNPGVALSRDQILHEVYEYDADIATDRVDLLVRRLRSKLGWNDRLVAVPGYGYRLEKK